MRHMTGAVDPCDALLRVLSVDVVADPPAESPPLATVRFGAPRADMFHLFGMQGGFVAAYLESGIKCALREWPSTRELCHGAPPCSYPVPHPPSDRTGRAVAWCQGGVDGGREQLRTREGSG